jgi:hypothetical protein
MNRMHRFIASLFLAAALVTPVSIMAPASIMAAAKPQSIVSVRVYDRDHRDYHDWDDRENHRWGVYLSNNHRRYYEYSHASRREQSRYWNYRHSNGYRD